MARISADIYSTASIYIYELYGIITRFCNDLINGQLFYLVKAVTPYKSRNFKLVKTLLLLQKQI
jgi:hypothetical protein